MTASTFDRISIDDVRTEMKNVYDHLSVIQYLNEVAFMAVNSDGLTSSASNALAALAEVIDKKIVDLKETVNTLLEQ